MYRRIEKTNQRTRLFLTRLSTLAVWALLVGAPAGWASLPEGPLVFGAFEARFDPAGTYSIGGEGWPNLEGTWRIVDDELLIDTRDVPGCEQPGRYRWTHEAPALRLVLIEDDCRPRQMILGASVWYPKGQTPEAPPRVIEVERFEHTALPPAAEAEGRWPSFRGPLASGVPSTGDDPPKRWNVETGENVLWSIDVPGLGHASPTVWGDRIFVATAVSSRGQATFRPGLYGDGDADDDRSEHRFELHAFDRRTGETLWSRVAAESTPIDKRHIKSTYANSTPATDGRVVVAWFGSQGVFAYTTDGKPLWRADVGRLDLGAYDVPSYEWGPASSPILWQGRVILQCDTQHDSFLLALDAATGKVLWKTERDEPPGWGTPTVLDQGAGPELVTNGANFVRGYDPKTGEELWRLGRSSKITAPTPIGGQGLIVVTSGRAPERPIFVIRPGSRGDLTLPEGETSSDSIAWSVERRGSYMPTPIVVGPHLYVLANNGVLDAYELETGREIYRQRLTHRGSGFSASPVAAGDTIYLPSEDGDILVVKAGETFEEIVTNSMDDLLMATPAIAHGVLYVRTARKLYALGRP